MRVWSKSGFGMIVAAIAFGAGGCEVAPSRISFIEKLAKENRLIARSTRSFHAAIKPLKDGQPADPGQVRSAYQAMEKTLKDVQAEMEKQLPPASSNSGKSFLSAYKEYLNGQQKILTDDLQPIVKKVEEPGAPAEKWAFVNGMLNQAVAKDNADFALLKKAEDDFASEHNYLVQTMEAYFKAQAEGKQ